VKNAVGGSPCGAETRERQRRAEYEFVHDNAPNARMTSSVERMARISRAAPA
jgi:hypothetical protein